MINLQKMAGLSALSQALIYISAFIYFGAFWSFPQDASALQKMTYLAENQFIFSIMLFLMYAVFGVFLAVLVVGLHERLKHTNNPVMTIGTVFGLIWVGLVIASGMISNIGLAHAIDMMDANPEKAFEVWTIIALITESLGGGNELVGGLWVLLVSIAALQAQIFSRGLNYLGFVVGAAGIATVYPDEIFTELFGVSQIIWFIWLGIALLIPTKTNK